MTFRQEEYMFIFTWKNTCLHMQLWAKFHSEQLLMRLMVGLMPVRLELLHRTGEGKQSQSFKMTVNLRWMLRHPRYQSASLLKSATLSAEPTSLSCLKLNWFSAQRSHFLSLQVCRAAINALSSCFDILDHPLPPHLLFSPHWQSYNHELPSFLFNIRIVSVLMFCRFAWLPQSESKILITNPVFRIFICNYLHNINNWWNKPLVATKACCCLVKWTFTDYIFDLLVSKWDL